MCIYTDRYFYNVSNPDRVREGYLTSSEPNGPTKEY